MYVVHVAISEGAGSGVSPPGWGHSSSCPLGRGCLNAGSAVTAGGVGVGVGGGGGVTLWRRRGEQVLLPPPPLGLSARLSCPRRGGSPTSRLPAARAAGRLSPPFPRRSAFCPRCLDRRRSFLLGNKKCLFSTEGWIRASTTDGRERFYRVFWPLEQRLMFTVSGNSEACFQTPRLV